MAEIVVSAVSESLINKLISITSQEINLVWGVKGELTKLQKKLTDIRAVLIDAEKKQVDDELVKNWLRKLKDVAYDVEDIFDEYEYEALRQKLEIQGRLRNKVRNFFSLSNPLAFRLKMARKVKEIHQMLDGIANDKDRFQLNVASTTIENTFKNRETYSVIDDSMVVGRTIDKSKIIDMLINCSNNQEIYSVVRIVGFGGVGKTTLTQFVYADKSVTHHFDIKLWVCVSQNSSEKDIFNKLLESINGNRSNISSLDVMVNSLKENLGRKKYLIVLDDVWNDENINWDDMLKTLLFIGVEGSKIVVTTRSEEVASITGFHNTHRLVGLPEEDCWSIFEQTAFGHGGAEKTPNLIEIGKEIVKKCGGVPLAAKTLGGLMHSKTDESDWVSIQNSEIWNLPEGEKKIMGVLKLSYDHLPPYLKQCFSYCSIFPRDHIINKKKLIQLWMAEGFLSPSKENKVLENIGNEYFNHLLRNSFLHDEQRNMWGDIKSCKMHDLVHDLALVVAGSECSIINTSRIKEEEIIRLRRVSLVLRDDFLSIPEAMYKARKLRTFVSFTTMSGVNIIECVPGSMFLNLRYLRVLDLCGSAIEDLPHSIGNLKHLRYVDFSDTRLTTLPDAFTSLYNLQTLRVKLCNQFKEFPKDMKNLISLRHLIISKNETQWTQMPRSVGKLSCLQKLSIFVVGKQNGFGIEELEGLKLLGGKLEIHGLENVRDGIDARKANLKEKQNIQRLELYWNDGDSRNVIDDDYSVLEGLQPHRNLKRLGIHHFVASKFPTWMSSAYCLPNLVSIFLWDCNKCKSLPALGQLPFLKVLHVCRMSVVKIIGGEFYGSNEEASNIPFPSLKELALIFMPNLEEWIENLSSSSSFPCLEQLKIDGCSKLIFTPTLFPSLKRLKFEDSNGRPVWSMATRNLTSLTSIDIRGCEELMFLPQGLLHCTNVLRFLEIHDCPNFEAFLTDQEELPVLHNSSLESIDIYNLPVLMSVPHLWGLNSLRNLRIVGCQRLTSLPDGLQCLTALEQLHIGGYSEELNSFPFPAIGDATDQCLGSLRVLSIHGWFQLSSLPDQVQYLTSLQELTLYDIPSLVTLPEWLGNLISLRCLMIHRCQSLIYLPSEEQMRRLTALQVLQLRGCDFLVERCFDEDAHKIAHIPGFYCDRL